MTAMSPLPPTTSTMTGPDASACPSRRDTALPPDITGPIKDIDLDDPWTRQVLQQCLQDLAGCPAPALPELAFRLLKQRLFHESVPLFTGAGSHPRLPHPGTDLAPSRLEPVGFATDEPVAAHRRVPQRSTPTQPTAVVIEQPAGQERQQISAQARTACAEQDP
jgi:hypothetical protein